MSLGERAPIAVIGIGSPMRTDDGVGPFVIEQLDQERLDPETDRFDELGPIQDVELVSLDGEPTRLIEAWRDRRFVIVIDAVAAATSAGTIHRVEVGVDPLPGWASGPSSHHGGLAEAVALADVLGRRAGRLVILGIEPQSLAPGDTLTPAVAASVPTLLTMIREEIRSFTAPHGSWPRSTTGRTEGSR